MDMLKLRSQFKDIFVRLPLAPLFSCQELAIQLLQRDRSLYMEFNSIQHLFPNAQ